MKNYFHLYNLVLIFLFVVSCHEIKKTNHHKVSTSQLESSLSDSSSTITNFNTINSPNSPTRITRKIKQDKEGNLLIAAYESIIRYDGKSFTNITEEAGLENCYAFDVLEDKEGNVWIASDQKGAFRIDALTGEISNFTTNDGLAHMRNMCIYEDIDGNIWIGGGGGLSRYDGKSFVNFTTEDGMSHNDINTIMEDRSGRIWIGTRGTACVYDPSKSSFTEILNNGGKPFENVWSIIEDKNGNIWLNSRGLWRYDGNAFTHITPMEGICIYEDKKGNVWFNPGHTVIFEAGLSRFDEKSLKKEMPIATEILKTNGTFLGISKDKEGNIWIGGGDGVWRYDGKTITYFTGKQVKE